MKKIIYSTLIYSLAILAGCQQIDEVADGAQDNGTAGQKVTLVANIAGSTDTKVSLTPDTDNNGNPIIKVDWKPSGEKFYVMGPSEIAEFTQVSDNLFEGVLPEAYSDGSYTAFYCREEFLTTGDCVEAYSEQDGTLDEKYVLMIADFDAQSESITFNHATSIFKLAFKYNDEPLTNITSVTVGDKPRTHEISITPPEGKEALNDDIYMHVACTTNVVDNGQMMFKVMAGDKEYEASLTIPSDVDLEFGKLYTATVNLSEVTICELPRVSPAESWFAYLQYEPSFTSIKFIPKSSSVSNNKIPNSNAYIIKNTSTQTIEVHTIASKFVLHEYTYTLFKDLVHITSIDFNNCVDTHKLKVMDSMFQNCKKLTELDLSCFNVSNVTNFNNVFWGCESLISINLSSFDTSNATGMTAMFAQCKSFESLDLSHFNTSNLAYMSYMFTKCRNMKSLDIRSFMCDLENSANIFEGFASEIDINVDGRAKVYVNKAFRDELYENGMYDYSYAQDASYKYEYVVVDASSNDPS